MILSKVDGLGITGIAAAVSNNWTSLTKFIKEESDEKMIRKFMKSTGVTGRYDAGERQTTSDFCYAAARELIRTKSINVEEVGALVFVTQTPDYGIPATACVLQHRLGLSKDCICFDVNLGCSGFAYGINIISSLMKTNKIKKALLLCGDTSAKRKTSSTIKNTHAANMLFGDSGTATILEAEEDSCIFITSRTDGSGFRAIISPFKGWRNPYEPKGGAAASSMNDMDVFEFSTSEVPTLINETMDELQTTPDDYDCLVLHQANQLIMKQIAKKTGFTPEKNLVSLDQFGNTSSSSIPITLVKHYGEMKEERKIHALMCGFGVGLSWSTVDAYVNLSDILPLIHTDEYFEDGYYVAKSNE